MLLEKYRPSTLEELERIPVARLLGSFSSETFPSLIFTGPEGGGKRSLLRAFLLHIFGKESAYSMHRVSVQVSASKTVDVQFLENNECVEVLVKSYGQSDKKVLQYLAKDMAQTKSIRGLLSGRKEENVKVLVIPDGESLSLGAQMALRRIMESGAANFRIILLTTGVSSFIAPFRSRFLICRVPALSKREMQSTIQNILEKEEIESITPNYIGEIVRTSRGNMRRALALLEATAISQKPVTCLDWEKDVTDLASKISTCASVSGLPAIRAAIMSILEKGVDCSALLCLLVEALLERGDYIGEELLGGGVSIRDSEFIRRGEHLMNTSSLKRGESLKNTFLTNPLINPEPHVDPLSAKVAEQGAKYSIRLNGGTRDLFHLEAFSIHAVLAHLQNKQTQGK